METRIQQISLLGINDVIENIVSRLQQNETINNMRNQTAYQTEFENEIKSFQKVLGGSANLENVKLVGTDGKILLSTDHSENGRVYSGMNTSTGKSVTPNVHFDSIDNKRKTIVTVPVLQMSGNNKTSSRTPIGKIVATMDTKPFDEILLNRKGLGRTGEVYLVNQNKKMITDSRFIENAAFHQTVDTLPVRDCFEKGEEIHAIYNDYRNIPIVGFSYCAKDLGLVLLAEIDEAEIFGPITQLKNEIIVASIAISAIVVAIAFYVSKTISKPIIRLRDEADRVTKSIKSIKPYEDYKVEIKSNDEIGHLAAQFDKMRKSVLETNMNLNMLVKERTKELTDMTNALDATAIVLVTDRNERITKINKKFTEISKYSEGELIGQNPRIVNSGYQPASFFEQMRKTITSGRLFEGEIRNRSKDGYYYWVKTTIVPFLDESGLPKQYIAIQNVITDLKNFEYELQEALKRDKESSEIIKRQVEELRRTNAELRRKDKLKEEFLSMTSHELKTPLTPIIGWCGALRTPRVLGELSSKQLTAVETIESNAIKLERLISDMLDAQKLDLDELKFSFANVEVDNLFNKTKKDFEPLLKEKNIQFVIRAEPRGMKLKSDESRIIQVISAL